MSSQRGRNDYLPTDKENPFVTGTSVLGNDFYGRKDELEQVIEFLGKKKEHHLLIHGQRRIGKTSLLLKIKELVNASGTMGKAIFFDLQNKARLDISEVLSELTLEICMEMELDRDLSKKNLPGSGSGNFFKEEFLPEILKTLPGKCNLILLFDEFDTLGDMEGIKSIPKMSNIAYHKFIPLIREIKEKEFPVKIIFAVGRNYKDLDEGRYGQITKSGGQIELTYFNKKELETLIRSSDNIIPFEPETIDKIYAYTSGHPFFSQCLASAAFDEAERIDAVNVTPEMIDHHLEAAVKRHGGGSIWLWKGFPPKDRIILYLMALVKEDNIAVNEKNIKTLASRLNLVPAIHQLSSTLEQLVNLKIIYKKETEPIQYAFYVEFFRKWILKENSVEKIAVLLEELNPEIKHYINNGQYYYDQGEFKESEKWFKKIIEKYPSHYEALFNLGEISVRLMEDDQQYLENALEMFSMAYALNRFATKDEYVFVLRQKLNRLESEGEETVSILTEIQRVNPGELETIEKLVQRYMVNGMDLSQLDSLEKVKTVILKDVQIPSLPGEITLLTGLEHLDLSGNRLVDISLLSSLTNLVLLNLNGNNIIDLAPLTGLINLSEINISGNSITDVSPISTLLGLKALHLNENKINDISSLCGLLNLRVLNLRKNALADISSLMVLNGLKRLDVTNNRISRLPVDVLDFGPTVKWKYHWKGHGLYLENNPLESPPVEIVKQGLDTIRRYFDSQRDESISLLEAKLLIVGNGEVGKTTLMRKLKDHDFMVKVGMENTTHGIKIQPWELSCPFKDGEIEKVRVHFWDFGGQDIYHATHQFFLTKRSLYLFVWEARKDDDTHSFDYWLNIIKLLSDNSPVIVVMNKSDIRMKYLDEAGFKAKFNNIVTFLQVSCLTGDGIDKLLEQIRITLGSMPHLQDRLPGVWIQIRDHLKGLSEDYISLNEYFGICREYGLDETRAMFLSAYLHDLGVIIHFHDSILENTVILNPEWATEAVYSLLDSRELLGNYGRFKPEALKSYWKPSRFPREKHPHLLRLMERFELCFNVVGTDTYIIPELLPPNRPPMDFETYRKSRSLQFLYNYEFMPDGIISRFITRKYYLIENDRFWKNGVELNFESSSALVYSEPFNRRVLIFVIGPSKLELLAIIKNEFEYIHKSLNMDKNTNFRELIPCNCNTCLKSETPFLHNYDFLKKLSFKGKLSTMCRVSLEDVPIETLLRGALIAQTPVEPLLNAVIRAVANLQGLSKNLKPDEDSRSSFIGLLLSSSGFNVKDQTRWGSSPSGKSMGRPDIKVDSPGGNEALIEAYNLNYLDRSVIDKHFSKLFHYDANGLPVNFLLIYSEADDFFKLWKRYMAYLSNIPLQFPLSDQPEEQETGYTGIKLARTRHLRQGSEVIVYHIFVDMNT